jgi:Protein of unknown function (DUF5818)
MKRIFLSLAGYVILSSMITPPIQSTALVTPAFQTQAPVETETFFGTILKNGNNFVLSDAATKTRYALDNPKKAGPYEGTTVKVTGMLDMASNLIHIETIEQVV